MLYERKSPEKEKLIILKLFIIFSFLFLVSCANPDLDKLRKNQEAFQRGFCEATILAMEMQKKERLGLGEQIIQLQKEKELMKIAARQNGIDDIESIPVKISVSDYVMFEREYEDARLADKTVVEKSYDEFYDKMSEQLMKLEQINKGIFKIGEYQLETEDQIKVSLPYVGYSSQRPAIPGD